MTAAAKPPAACLIGWPAAHSRSPLIHRYWLRTLGIEGGYVIEAVPPDIGRMAPILTTLSCADAAPISARDIAAAESSPVTCLNII